MGKYDYISWSDFFSTSSYANAFDTKWNNLTDLIDNGTSVKKSMYSWKSFQKEKPDLGEKIVITEKDKINYYVVEFLGMESVRKYNAKYWKYLNKCDL